MSFEIIAKMAGKKVKMKERTSNDIGLVSKGKRVILFFKNGDEYHGIFDFLDDKEIVIKSLYSTTKIGLPKSMLDSFLLEK